MWLHAKGGGYLSTNGNFVRRAIRICRSIGLSASNIGALIWFCGEQPPAGFRQINCCGIVAIYW